MLKPLHFIILLTVLLLSVSFDSKADVEPNNNLASANFIATNGSDNGSLGAQDLQDWYYFIANGDGDVSVTATFSSGLTGFITLVTPDAVALVGSSPSNGTVTIDRNCLTSDTLYIVVQRSANSGTYSVSNTWVENISGNDPEPNDDIASATFLSDGISSTGHLGYAKFSGITGTTDFQDYYQIITTAGGEINASAIFGNGMTGFIRLLTEDNGNLATSATGTGIQSISVSCLAADTFYLQVRRSAGCGGYTVSYQNLSPVATDDTEPNNSAAESLTLTEGITANGSVGFTSYVNNVGTIDQFDWYVFTIPSSDSVTLSANFESGLTGFIRVYNQGLFVLETSSTGTGALSASLECLAADTLYVSVTRTAGCGDYSLDLNVVSSGNPEDQEPNNSVGEAIMVGSSSTNTGSLGYLSFVGSSGITDVVDWYRFVLPEDGNIDINVSLGGNLTGAVSLLTKNSGVLQSSGTGVGPLNVGASCQSADTFLVSVIRASGCGGYSLDIQTTSSSLTNDVEPNNGNTIAIPLSSGVPAYGHLGYVAYSGLVGTTDNQDWYRLILPEDGKIDVVVDFESPLSGRFDIISKDNAGLISSTTGTGVISDDVDCLAADTFFIRVVQSSGCAGYSIVATATTATLNNDSEPNNTFAEATSINLNNSYTGHLGYVALSGLVASTDQIDFYSFNIVTPGNYTIEANLETTFTGRLTLNNSSQAILAQTPNGTGQILLNHNFTAVGQYFVSVFRNSSNTCGSYQLFISPSVAACGAVANLNTTNLSFNSVTLNWDAVAGADHYEVRGGLAGSNPANYITLTIPSGATTSFNVIGLTEATSYEWQMRSHCDAAETMSSSWSALNVFTTLSCTAPSPASTSMLTATSARLNWTVVPNADGYEILGRQAGSSVIVTLVVPNGSTDFFDVAGLAPNTSYEWAVRTICAGGAIRSGFTSIQTFTTTNGPSGKVAELGQFVKLYPNPASDQLHVQMGDLSVENMPRILVYDMAGKEVYNEQIDGDYSLATISVGHLQNGMYQLVLTSNREIVHHGRFSVSR